MDVTATSTDTGQSAGALTGSAAGARIAAVYATGAVTGYQQAGGLVGNLTNSSVLAVAWADVAVSSTRGPGPGGLAGHAQENAIIRVAYAIGTAAQTNSGIGWGTAPLSTNAALNDVYFNSDTGGTLVDAELGKTTAQLQSPTGYTGLYANWNVDLDGDGTADDSWDFGTSDQYPALKFDRNKDGVATVDEFPLQPVRIALVDYDSDDDNLIEITTLAQLDAIRWDLDGNGPPAGSLRSSYVAAFTNAIDDSMGCPGTCAGYELAADLDFDTNGDGRMDIAGDDYWNGGKGWQPIGTDQDGYQAVFNGNGHTISNLYMNRGTFDTSLDYFHGLFRITEGRARISYVGLVNVNVTGYRWVGALVGRMESSEDVIAASYVTGRVHAVSEPDGAGGLVGEATYGKVIASWANVNVSANDDSTGGLVGLLNRSATGGLKLTASYALGDVAAGGNADAKAVGGLVGWVGGNTSIADSYFDTQTIISVLSHGRVLIDRITRGKTTTQLQAPTGYTGIYAEWDVDVNGDGVADDPWDFGASGDYPRLKADRNGDGVFTAAEFGRLAGVAAVNPGVTQGGPAQFRITVDPAPTADLDVNLSVTAYGQTAATHTVTVPAGQTTAVIGVRTTSSTAVGGLRATVAGGRGYAALGQATVYVNGPGDYDTDDDGLIEVSDLAQLDAIRHDLPANDNGAYVAAFSDPAAAPGMGCAPCLGYELAGNLDFDTNKNGAADDGDTYWNDGDGWTPIGTGWLPTGASSYAGEFHGNGHTISNLYINRNRRGAENMGLFGGLAAGGAVHHLGLHNADVTGYENVGALAGTNHGSIYAVYTTGEVSAESYAGGIVGWNYGSVSTVWSDARVSAQNTAGGIVGANALSAGAAATVTASYFRGNVRASWGLNPTFATYEKGLNSMGTTFGGAVGGQGRTSGSPATGTISHVYYSSDDTFQKRGGTAQTAAELQAPTGYEGIYANWNVDVDDDGNADNLWEFGTADHWPSLRGVDEPPVSRPTTPGDNTFKYTYGDGLYRPNSRAELRSSGSYDPEGQSLSYLWEQTDANTVSLSNARTANPTFTTPGLGEAENLQLYFRLTVTAGGLSDTDVTGIWVTEDEPPPKIDIPPIAIIADRGKWVRYLDDADRTEVVCTEEERDLSRPGQPGNPLCHYVEPGPVTEGTRVTLDGSGSTDRHTHMDVDEAGNPVVIVLEEGTIVSYAWEQVGTTGGTLANTSSSRATFTTPTGLTADTAYTIRLTVTDDDDLTDSVEITIQVTVQPIADAGHLVVVNTGEQFTLRGSGAGYPGETLTYDWSETDSPTQTAFGAPVEADLLAVQNLVLTAPVVDTDTSYTWTLTVTDSDGLTASDDVIVRVRIARTTEQLTPPTVDAGPDQEVVKGDEVTLAGNVNHPSEPLIAEWTHTGPPEFAELIYSPYTLTPDFTAPEVTSTTTLTFTLQSCIADDFALVSELICASDTVNITVLTEPRPPPPPGLAADAGSDQLVSPGSVVTLSGAVTLDGGPPDETLTYTYRWQQTSGTQVNLQNAALPTAGFRAPENDGAINLVLEFQLTVTETGTASRTATDTVRVEVRPATAGGQTGPGVTLGGSQQYFLVPFPLAFLDALMNPGDTLTIPVRVSISDGSDGNPSGSMVIVVQPPGTTTTR